MEYALIIEKLSGNQDFDLEDGLTLHPSTSLRGPKGNVTGIYIVPPNGLATDNEPRLRMVFEWFRLSTSGDAKWSVRVAGSSGKLLYELLARIVGKINSAIPTLGDKLPKVTEVSTNDGTTALLIFRCNSVPNAGDIESAVKSLRSKWNGINGAAPFRAFLAGAKLILAELPSKHDLDVISSGIGAYVDLLNRAIKLARSEL